MAHSIQSEVKRPKDLNPSQWNAVWHEGSHLLIIAGPGTGKTHTLTYRIAKKIENLTDGERILAITFTNKAAKEMRERLEKRVIDVDERLTVGTFHSFCLQLLRKNVVHTPLPEDFRVASAEEMLSLSDPAVANSPTLPTGHPFRIAASRANAQYLTSSTLFDATSGLWSVVFVDFRPVLHPIELLQSDEVGDYWCVRGGSSQLNTGVGAP